MEMSFQYLAIQTFLVINNKIPHIGNPHSRNMKNSILSSISTNHAGGTALLALSLIGSVGAATLSPESSGPSFQIPPGT